MAQGKPPVGNVWGKFRPVEQGGPAWLPLVDHAADVAAMLQALLRIPQIRSRLARTAGRPLTETDLARLAVLAFLHDFGKCASGFQRKLVEPEAGIGHMRAALALLGGDGLAASLLEALELHALVAWGSEETILSLLLATLAHHGRPPSLTALTPGEERRIRAAWEPWRGYDPRVGLRALAQAARRTFRDAFATDVPPLPDSPLFHHLFAGLLQLADWFGSSEAFFPWDETRPASAFRRAREVVERLRLDPAVLALPALPRFEDQFGFPPNAVQALVDLLPETGVAVLEAPTGSGKTEAALRWATRLWQAGGIAGVYFALPLRAAAVQMHRRLQVFLDRTFGTGRVEAVLAVPGYVRAGHAEGIPLPGFEVQWTDDPDAERRAMRWAAEHPRRFLAAPFAVGTVDQALLAVLAARHAHLRLACLARSLLIVDEVHASDRYMERLIAELVAVFRELGGRVLLMSATLGSRTRACLLAEDPRRPAAPPPAGEARAHPYPAFTTPAGPIPVRGELPVKRVRPRLLPAIDEPARIAGEVARWIARGVRVAVVRNTVGQAIEIQRALEERLGIDHPALFRVCGTPTLHHGRFHGRDRVRLDRAIETRFGKNAPGGSGVVVATQTIEQSLDLDFDVLITDICPIDVLLQRIGRLWRHRRPRPDGMDAAPCLVLVPRDGLDAFLEKRTPSHNLGPERAYADLRAVEACRRLVAEAAERGWELPRQNRELVERGTHPGELVRIARELGEAWVDHGSRVEGQGAARAQFAHLHLLPTQRLFSDPDLALAEEPPEAVRTRLGEDRLLVALDPPLESPFGEMLDEMPVPAWLLRLVGAEPGRPVTGRVEGSEIWLAEGVLIYDRLGLRSVAPARDGQEDPGPGEGGMPS